MISPLKPGDSLAGILASNSLVMVDFYADWCEPCKVLDTILVQIDKEYDKPLLILKIDADQHSDLVKEYAITSVPVVMIIKERKLMFRINGFLTLAEFLEKLKSISRETV
jgi:thioredoxin 1